MQRLPGVESLLTWGMRAGAQRLTTWRVEVAIEGQDHLPLLGPAVLACRHYHHFWDGCVLLGCLPRPIAAVVGLDWLRSRWLRWVVEGCCRAARWPVVLRADGPVLRRGVSAYRPAEIPHYLRRAFGDVGELLRAGRVVVCFPEGYPTVDPHGSMKATDETLLPFRGGFARFVLHAQRNGLARVPIVPVGFVYQGGPRWRITLCFGPPLFLDRTADCAAVVQQVEAEVRRLSRLDGAGAV